MIKNVWIRSSNEGKSEIGSLVLLLKTTRNKKCRNDRVLISQGQNGVQDLYPISPLTWRQSDERRLVGMLEGGRGEEGVRLEYHLSCQTGKLRNWKV